MKNIRSHSFFKILTFLFLVIYCCCVLTNILVLPNRAGLSKYVPAIAKKASLVSPEKDITSKKALRLISRSIVTKIQYAQTPALLLLLFVFCGFLTAQTKGIWRRQSFYLYSDKQYSYLCFLNIRV